MRRRASSAVAAAASVQTAQHVPMFEQPKRSRRSRERPLALIVARPSALVACAAAAATLVFVFVIVLRPANPTDADVAAAGAAPVDGSSLLDSPGRRAFHRPGPDLGDEPDEYQDAVHSFEGHVTSLKESRDKAIIKSGTPKVQSEFSPNLITKLHVAENSEKGDPEDLEDSPDSEEESSEEESDSEEEDYEYEEEDHRFAEMEFEDGIYEESGRDSRDWHGHDYHAEAWDDDEYRASEKTEDGSPDGCREPAFSRHHRPTCNLVHEEDLLTGLSQPQHAGATKILGEGAYRTTFRVPSNDEALPYAAFKSVDNEDEDRYIHEFLQNLEMQRLDAMVMDLLSPSPRISDIYAYCALASMTEMAELEMEPIIIPFDNNDPPDLDGPVRSLNNLTVAEKLQLALDFARPIGDMHGYHDGIIMHVDIKPDQYMIGVDGVLKLIDFNRAEAIPFNEEDGLYCQVNEGGASTIYRSPEEIAAEFIDEQADVYNYAANIVYSILTGIWVHSITEDEEYIRDRLLSGRKPFYDKRFKSHSFGEAALCKVLESCWEYEPSERASIFWVIRYLERAILINKELESRGAADAEDMNEWKGYLFCGERCKVS